MTKKPKNFFKNFFSLKKPKEQGGDEAAAENYNLNTGNMVNPNPARPSEEEREQTLAHETNTIEQNTTQSNSFVSSSSPQIPTDVLSSIVSTYTGEQIDNDLRDLRESLKLLSKTDKLEIFFSRHELAMQKIAKLEMAKKARLVYSLPTSLQEVTKLRERAEDVLFQSYKKELQAIKNQKNTSAKIKRIDQFIQYVKMYEKELSSFDGYNKILNELYTHKKNLDLK